MVRAEDVVKYLETVIPLRAPDIKWSDREIWMYAGQRKTIDLIYARIAELEEAAQPVIKSQE
jgi:hypothetical protein